MAPKKGKGGNGSKKKVVPPRSRKGANKQTRQTELDNKLEQQSQLNPQERVAFVRPLWETLSDAERVDLLTVTVADVVARLKQQNKEISEGTENEVSLKRTYERGLKRLIEDGTWKVWRWDAKTKPYTCAETFKKEELEKNVPEELRKLLPREEGKPTEKPAEAALRERMTTLINNIQTQLQSAQEAWRRGQRAVTEAGEQTRDANIDLVISILDTLQHEHRCLYHTILMPVAEFISTLVPAKNRKSTKTELFFEDFEKITPEDVAKLYEWLTEKVDALCSKLKPDPKDEDIDEDEEAVGDIDLFTLTEDKTAYTVNSKWMEHLQDRKLSEEGQPRKVRKGEDEHRVGLVLEWVYGSIVSTAEKARDGAKRPLGNWQPSVTQAHQNLLEMLRDQKEWDSISKSAKALLKEMQSARKKTAVLMKQYNVFIPGTAAAKEAGSTCDDLPDGAIEGVLYRESILTQAKLHILKYERLMATNQLKTIRAELMHGEPEFERLNRELENAKNLVRNSDKDRQRSTKMNESLLEEQLEVQSAFREQRARLQGMYDKRQRTELEIARREQEIGQLENWHKNVIQLMGKLQKCSGDDGDEAGLTQVRTAFHKDFKKQLYTDGDDQTFLNRIKTELKTVDKRVEDGAVVLQHLEMFLINVACDDPGAQIGTTVILPLLQERLDNKALEFRMQRASEAMHALLEMEEEKNKLKEKKELKKKSKSATQIELTACVDASMEDDSPVGETTQTKTETDELLDDGKHEEPATLGSHSLEDPLLIEQSIRYEASLLAEAEAEEFQSVSNKRRGDRKKAQSKRAYASPPRRAPSNRQTEGGEHGVRRTHSSPAEQSSKSQGSGAKVFVNKSKSARVKSESQPKDVKKPWANRNKHQKSTSMPEVESVADEKSVETKPQRVTAAWVKGAIPASVTSGVTKNASTELVQTSSSKQSAASESSINVPSTPDASDVDRHLKSVKSDPMPKDGGQLSLEQIKTTLPHQDEIQALSARYENTDSVPEKFNGDGSQFFHMVQAMAGTPDATLNKEAASEDAKSENGKSDRSSDAATPEPVHLMMGPPLMPPPLGMPPPIGPLPAFHPGFYGPMRPMVGPNGVRFPVPPVFHPSLSAPVTSIPETSEAESPVSTTTPPYPYFPVMHGHHMPMPPYLPVMPYGQWFPPGVPPMAAFDSQVRKFPLRPTAEEFVPPSMKHDDSGVTGDGETPNSDDPTSEEPQASMEDSNKPDYSNVDVPNESAVAVTQTIEQTC